MNDTERRTGATDEQVNRAARAYWRRLSLDADIDSEMVDYSQISETIKNHMRAQVSVILGEACGPNQRIVEVADLRAICAVALDSRELAAANQVIHELNRRVGEMTSDEMNSAADAARKRWNERYPEFADAIKRIETAIG